MLKHLLQLAAALLFGLLLVVAFPARADAIYKQGDDWVRVTALACNDEAVKKQITAAGGDPKDFRQASVRYEGKEFAACWRPLGAVAHLVYADGDQGLVQMEAFEPVNTPAKKTGRSV